MPIQYSDSPEVLIAIQNIKPGDNIIYGWCWLQPEIVFRWGGVNQRRPTIDMGANSIPNRIRKLINQLDRSKRIMLFQKREENKFCCLAIGVTPQVRLSLEEIGKKA